MFCFLPGTIPNHLILPTKINSRWIKNSNVRPETIQILEETRENLIDNSLDSVLCCVCVWFFFFFFWSDIKSKGNQSKISKWHYIQLKSFYTEKEKKNQQNEKSNLWNGRIYLPIIYWDKIAIFYICTQTQT